MIGDVAPPPKFYLSIMRGSPTGTPIPRFWLFSDVKEINKLYQANLHREPLQGMNAPYISQGSGSGFTWRIQATINPMNAFVTDTIPRGTQRAGGIDQIEQGAYDDYISIEQTIEDFGPSPLMFLHQPSRPITTVALEGFNATINLSLDDGENTPPHIIPVEMVLVERRQYKVKVR